MEISWNFVSPKKWEPWLGSITFVTSTLDSVDRPVQIPLYSRKGWQLIIDPTVLQGEVTV